MHGKYLHISIAVVLIFIAILLYYIVSPLYLGFFPIGIITAGCILAQIAMLFLSGKNIAMEGFQMKTIAALGVEVLSAIGMGYFFIVWLMVI